MSKHTPGPWGISPQYFQYVVSGTVVVADCYPDVPSALSSPPTEQYPANQQLIAAAPEMLEGLRAILQILRDGNQVDAIHDAHWIERLIKKATGTAP